LANPGTAKLTDGQIVVHIRAGSLNGNQVVS
jgi:hypothetical protein